jgi:hypothetical protein
MLTIYTGNYSRVRKHIVNKGMYLKDVHMCVLDKDFLSNTLKTSSSNTVLVNPCALSSEKSQYEFGLLLCELENDINIFTHSSVLINGVCVGLKRGIIEPEQLLIVFIDSDGVLINLPFDKDGRCSVWPEGFMYTHENALIELLRGNNS